MRGPRWQPRLTLALALVTASMPVSPALGIGTLDQEQPTIDATVGGLAIGWGSQQKLGQTFTAGLTGTLTDVDLPVACDAGATLTVEIHDVAGGAPGATVLASTSVPAASLPQFFPAPPSFRTISFASGAAVTAGIAYALVLSAGNPGCGIFRGPVGDPYAAGDLYFDARPNALGWLCECDFANARRDLPFRTYVAVTPTTADLALTLVDVPDPVFASFSSFAYWATVTNNGPAVATGISVTFTLPADLDLAPPPPPSCTVTLPTVTCTLSNLGNGGTGQIGINVKLANGTSATSVTVGAVVSSVLVDPVAANNAASETTTVKAVVDMEVLGLSAAPSPANVGDQIVYAVTVKNKASTYSYPATSAGALMSIPSGPAAATFVSVTSPVAGALCGYDAPSNRYGCRFGTLASNATATMFLTFTAPTFATTLASTAESSAAEPELQPSDNTQTVQVQVVGEQTTFFGQGGTTDVENCTPTGCDGATAGDPIETTVNLPAGTSGTITIREVPTTGTPPSGYSLLGTQVSITAPAGTATMPLTVTFEIHPSLIPAGQNVSTIQVFRNGVLVPPCTNPAVQQAAPDPCVWQRQTLPNGNALIAVLTSSASVWSFGIHTPFAFSGFFDAKTRVTAGSTVHLRFSLGGDHGLGIVANAFSIPCGGGASQIAPSGSTRLLYEAESGTYRLQWKTDRSWSGTCRELKVQLIDGSVHVVAVDFR